MDQSELVRELRIERGVESSSWRNWLIIGLVALLLAGAGSWFWSRLTAGESASVRTAVVRAAGGSEANSSVLDATGYVTPRRIATVSAKITGKVVEVLIEEGMQVSEGQILARLDDAEVQRDLQLAQARLQSARLDLAETKVRLGLAERDLQRQQELVERKLAAVQTLDSARAERDGLQARLQSSQGLVLVADRQTEVIRQQLDNTIIRAPFAGVIIAKAAQPGEMISPISAGGGFTRTGIGTIVDMDSLEIQVDVSESYINRVQDGQPVEARLNAYPDWAFPAKVIAVIPTADRSKATVKVRISIDSRDSRIVPDMGVRVAFLKDAAPIVANKPLEGVLIPASALLDDGEQPRVLTVQDGRVEAVQITVAERNGEELRVSSGLKAGQRVVLEPTAQLRSGDQVVVQ